MKNLWKEENGMFEVSAGSTIDDTIVEAIGLSISRGRVIKFEFNGVTVSVSGDSKPNLIRRDWSRALSGYIEKNVGPNPNPVLTDKEQANDAKIEADNEHKRQERQQKQQEAQRRHKLMLEGAHAAAPKEMTLKDEEGWKKAVEVNRDGYGSGVIRFAERWARLMDARITKGDTVEGCAEEASQLADNEGITGFMYGAAVSTLSQVWKYGDELRRWHNRKYGNTSL